MSRFRGQFDKQHVKRAQALLKSALLKSNSSTIPKEIELEKSLLLTCQILELLVNTLAADEKYLVLHRNNLTVPIQIQLSKKQKKISKFFAAFLKSKLDFEHFETKDDPHSFCISEITEYENVVI